MLISIVKMKGVLHVRFKTDRKYKNITKSFSSLNANEIEFLCTNNVGSHFIEQCVQIFSSKDRSLLLQSLLDKLKVG